jgi:nucleoside-diphosphate-sugar epimerase
MEGVGMKVLLTGADGYIGVRMGDYLIGRGHDVTGLDSGLHRVGWLYNSTDRRPHTLTKDTRDITVEDLAGFDAVVHLAEVSNDPVGELNPDVTYKINHHGSVRLATLAKQAGVQRFVHMSSCSVYGASGDAPSKEGDPTEPLTSYAKCKVLVEQDVAPLADDNFSPTFMRNATAYGASPRQRFDLVVNDLAASAFLYKEIRMASDGTPWRPFVHVLDISKAAACILEAPRDAIHNEIFNVGSDSQNHQVRQVAEIIGELVPGCGLIFGDSSADKRNYKADFTKIHTQLPGFSCDWSVEKGVADLLAIFAKIGFDEDLYRFRGHTRIKQVKHLISTGQVDDFLVWDR